MAWVEVYVFIYSFSMNILYSGQMVCTVLQLYNQMWLWEGGDFVI